MLNVYQRLQFLLKHFSILRRLQLAISTTDFIFHWNINITWLVIRMFITATQVPGVILTNWPLISYPSTGVPVTGSIDSIAFTYMCTLQQIID